MIEILIPTVSRKHFLRWSGALLAAAVLGDPSEGRAQAPSAKKAPAVTPVTPTEDLMREHGALSRILLIYDNIRERLLSGSPFAYGEVLSGSARVVRRFIEDYHEKLEENFIFPRFGKNGSLADLVKLLHDQHDAGRAVTDRIMKLAATSPLSASQKTQMAGYILGFNRMYRPHKAREDTVLFPALRTVVTPEEFDRMGDTFEQREKQLFGENGFERIVAEIDGYEKTLGINDLAKFTPKV
jgi:hemerythrin-like domain-containing protein